MAKSLPRKVKVGFRLAMASQSFKEIVSLLFHDIDNEIRVFAICARLWSEQLDPKSSHAFSLLLLCNSSRYNWNLVVFLLSQPIICDTRCVAILAKLTQTEKVFFFASYAIHPNSTEGFFGQIPPPPDFEYFLLFVNFDARLFVTPNALQILAKLSFSLASHRNSQSP